MHNLISAKEWDNHIQNVPVGGEGGGIFKNGFTLTLQETRSIHDSINIPKIEFIAYIYILL